MPEPSELDLVVLGGGGHVGLPLSLVFARAGSRVGILDVDADRLARIAEGVMPFREDGADALLREILPTGRLELSSDPSILERTDVVIVVIGTPIDAYHNPSTWLFDQTIEELAPRLRRGALVVLRSTIYPGTTERVADRLAERGCEAVSVVFCPERIIEGRALEELTTLPQIVGADSPEAGDRAEALFRHLVGSIVRTTSREAELAKLLTNTWRYMKFAVANQFFMIAHDAGIDYTNVLRAIREDYPRAADLPGPGFAAGPCLFKDAMQLAAFTSDHFPMGQSAMLINEGLPAYVVAGLERRYGSLRGKTIGILGMAFKAESDDPRSSLSYKLRKLLEWAGARPICSDPFVPDPRLVPVETVLEEADIVILGVPHRAYAGLAVGGRDIVDIWGAMGRGISL